MPRRFLPSLHAIKDAVKHDNCVDVANTTEGIAANTARYAALGAALNKTGRPILYDVVLQVAHAR